MYRALVSGTLLSGWGVKEEKEKGREGEQVLLHRCCCKYQYLLVIVSYVAKSLPALLTLAAVPEKIQLGFQ